jgi:hypothetical protein
MVVHDIDAVFDMLTKIADAGRRHAVFVHAHDPVAPKRETLLERDFFSLALDKPKPSADVCWFEDDGRVACGPATDLGTLLASLPDAASKIYRGWRVGSHPPVEIWGNDVLREDLASKDVEANLYLHLHSDIWFPYVRGYAHPSCRSGMYFDNTDLARRHTPRLNAFIAELGAIVSGFGSRLTRHEADGGYAEDYASWCSDVGIKFDGPAPALVPPERLDWASEEWIDSNPDADNEA